MSKRVNLTSTKYAGIKSNTDGKTWYADFHLPDGSGVISPAFKTEDAAAHARDKIFRCAVQDAQGVLPADYEDLAPHLMTAEAAATLVGKTWQQMKKELHADADAARGANNAAGFKFVEKRVINGVALYRSQVPHPVAGKKVRSSWISESTDPNARVLAAKAADRQNARWWGSDPDGPRWNLPPETYLADEDSVMRQAAMDRIAERVTHGLYGPYADRKQLKQAGVVVEGDTAPAASRPAAPRRPRAPAARAPTPAPPAAAEDSDSDYEPDYDSDAEGDPAAAAAALCHGFRLVSHADALRNIDRLREMGITYPFTDDPETQERPDDPHGVLDHLAGPEWYLPPAAAARHPEAKALWKSELALAVRKGPSIANRLFEEICMAEERMHPDDLKVNGEWSDELRRALICGRCIDEDGAVLRSIPGFTEMRKEADARRNGPPPTPEQVAADAAHRARWAPLPMTPEQEASLRQVYDTLEFDPGLEKYYMPYGQLAAESAFDYGTYRARAELFRERAAAVAEALALRGPDGLPDLDKVRQLALDLGDAFAQTAQWLCDDAIFRDWALSNLAALRRACGEGPFDFLDPGAAPAAPAASPNDSVPAAESAEGADGAGGELAGGPAGGDGAAAGLEALAAATATLAVKADSGRSSPAALVAAAGAAAAGGAPPPAPALAASDPHAQIGQGLPKAPQTVLDSTKKELGELQGAEAAVAAPAPAPAAPASSGAGPSISSGRRPKGKNKTGRGGKGPAASPAAAEKAGGGAPDAPDALQVPSPEALAAFEAHMMALSEEGLVAAMGGDLGALTRGMAAASAAVGVPLSPDMEAALEAVNAADERGDGAGGGEGEASEEERVAKALAAAAAAFRVSPEEFTARWEVVAPGLAGHIAAGLAGTATWASVEAALAGTLEGLAAAAAAEEAAADAAEEAMEAAAAAAWRPVREAHWNWMVGLARRQGRCGVAWLTDLLGAGFPHLLAAHPAGDVFGPHRAPPEVYDPLLLYDVYDSAILCPEVSEGRAFAVAGEMALARYDLGGERFFAALWRYWGPAIAEPGLANRLPVASTQAVSLAALGPHPVAPAEWGPEDDAFVAERLAKIERAGRRTRKDTVYLA